MQQQLDTNLYDVLGVPADASDKDIKRAYKKLAQQFHPDVNQGDPEAAERFKEISAANDVLGDPKKRAEYDEFQSMVGSGFSSHSGFSNRSGFSNSDAGDAGLDDLFSQMFTNRPMPTQVMRVEIGFADAVHGLDVSIGDAMVRLPAGVTTGDQLLVRGSDRHGASGEPAQPDVIVEVMVGKHAQFGRNDLHLTLEVPISITEALLGGKIKVPTFDGKPVGLKVPAGTPNGRTFRVKGRGIDTGNKQGDLLVSVHIEIPTELTDAQTEALLAYADATAPITHPNRI